jgi:hypothetical protein
MKKIILSTFLAIAAVSQVLAQTSADSQVCAGIASETQRAACLASQDDVGTSPSASSQTSQTQTSQTSQTTSGTPSIAGDEVCGSSATTECKLTDLTKMGKSLLFYFTMLGGAILVLFIALRLVSAWFAYRAGNTNAIKQAGEWAFNAAIGFLIIFAVAGGLFLGGLSYLGTQPWATKLFKLLSDMFVEHAYAATTDTSTQLLPNALGTNSAYELLLAGINLGMRFFVYPAIIVMWVWSGFQFVYSQGNPEGLKKARSWLMWAAIITVVAIMLQGFLVALKNTANKILSQRSSQGIVLVRGEQGRISS